VKSFLVDEDLPRSLARALSEAGMGAVHVIDAGFRGKPDSEVLSMAKDAERTLVTADLDFSNLLQFPLGSHSGIVVARFPSEMPVEPLNEAIVAALDDLEPSDLAGSLVIIEPGRVRIRR
jgi:predicted nuclease of predicted toxin-antitoxin system